MAQSEKIIISVELRDKGVTTGSKKAKKAVDDLTDSAKKLAKAEKELAFQESAEGKQLAALTIKKQLAAKANRELALSTLKNTKATIQGKTQTGLNNAILTEAGRTASDAAYGMQGMSNNLGQLLTLMSQHVKTKGGFVASMSELFKSLMGAGGVLIGLQLLISYLPQIQKWFEGLGGGMSIVNEAFEEVGDNMASTIGSFETYIAVLQDSTRSEEQHKIAIQRLKKEFPEYIQALDDSGVSLDDVKDKTKQSVLVNEQYRASILKLSKSKAAQAMIDKQMAKIRKEEFKAERKLRDIGFKGTLKQAKNQAEVEKLARQTNEQILRLTGQYDELLYSQNEESELEKIIDNLTKKTTDAEIAVQILMKSIELIKLGGSGGEAKAENIFKEKLLDYITEIKDARKIAQTEDVLSARQTLDAKQKFRRDELLNELNLFKTKEKLRLDDFKAKKGVTTKEKENAQATYDNEIDLAEKSYFNALMFTSMAERAEDNVFNAKEDIKEAAFKKDMERLERRIQTTKALVDSEGDEIKGLILPNTREQLEEDAANIQTEIAQKDLLLSKEIEDNDVRRTLEIDRTNLELELAKKRMTIAQIEEDAKRANIKNIIGLLGSASKFAKKGSDTSKALAIASTTVSTWTTAQAAAEVQTKAGGTTAPIRAAIAYAAAIAKGALTVKNIIAEKKPGGGSSGGGGGMPPVQPPDFNIIGSTGTNQLADAIGGTTQQPIKAYVVSGEVTSAQELDRNIVESASI